VSAHVLEVDYLVLGDVGATRKDDAEKNRVCPPTPLPNTPSDWCTMQVLGGRAVKAFSAEPDIKAWSDQVPLRHASAGMARFAELSAMR
jgi:hypothetical protein